MKFLALLALVSAAVATPLSLYDNGFQTPMIDTGDLLLTELPTEYPGFDLDLNEIRLVQLEGLDEPVEMTELQKVRLHTGLPPHALFSWCLPSLDSSQSSRNQILRCVSTRCLPIHAAASSHAVRTEARDLGSRAQFRAARKRGPHSIPGRFFH